MKKKKPTPVRIKGQSFGEMIADTKRKAAEAKKYVDETGLCCNCKKNPVVEGQIHCQSCLDKRERLLKQLRGPGFMELKV